MMVQMESLNGEVSKLKESEKQARSGLTASEAKVGQLQKESQTVKEELERVKAEGKAANDAARAKAAGTKELAAEKAKLEEEVKSLKVSERGPGAARNEWWAGDGADVSMAVIAGVAHRTSTASWRARCRA